MKTLTFLLTIFVASAYAQKTPIVLDRQSSVSQVTLKVEKATTAVQLHVPVAKTLIKDLKNSSAEKFETGTATKSNEMFHGGSEGTGGGDEACENRIKPIRDDLRKWIDSNGHNGLDLKGRGTPDEYKQKMLTDIPRTKVQCVGEGDPGFPVAFQGVPKTCVIERRVETNIMTCDFKKVAGHNDEQLYRQIHHEFATVTGFEIPNGGDSDYEISNQIAGYLVDQVVKRLSVLAVAPTCSTLDLRNVPVGTKCRTSVGAIFERVSRLNFGESWKGPDGVIWSDVVGHAIHITAFEICTRELGAFFPSKFLFQKAEGMGFREVLPGFAGRKFWIGTTDYINTPLFLGDYGVILENEDQSNEHDVRCATRK